MIIPLQFFIDFEIEDKIKNTKGNTLTSPKFAVDLAQSGSFPWIAVPGIWDYHGFPPESGAVSELCQGKSVLNTLEKCRINKWIRLDQNICGRYFEKNR